MVKQLAAWTLGIAVLACVVSPAAAQRWKYPPGPPYRSCPDTLTLVDVQQPDTTIAPCHPATLDTVWGIQGIITGFDARSSAYGFYIQTNNNNGFNGVDVFTGATNYNSSVPGTPTGGNLQKGDLVVVYGTTQEFPNPNGETEIEGPDAVQGTNDIIIRKLSSGNAIPPFKVGTTHDFNWVPSSSGNLGERYEGCLVKIRGPLRVARTTGSGLLGNNWLLVSVASPSPDSVMIDGFTLCTTAVNTPAVGTVIDSVQGILNQRTSGSPSVNSYRIQLRDGNDQFLAAPPGLAEAYPIEDNKLRLLFDRNLDPTTAQNPSKYSLGSGIDGSTVDAAVMPSIPGSVVELTITSVRGDGDAETVTSGGIGSASCPSCLSASQTLSFINGVIPISMIQAPNPASLPLFDDRSRFAGAGTAFGERLTTRGVGVQQYGSLYYLVDAGGGLRSGVSVFGPSQPLQAGHKYRIACRVQEFATETELVNTVEVLDEGLQAQPAPQLQTVHVLTDTTTDQAQNVTNAEDYEGVLVRVQNVTVVQFNTPPQDPSPGGSFRVIQGPDTILVSALGGNYDFDATAGDLLNVNGILHIDNGSPRILPRNDADIELQHHGAGVGDGGSLALALGVKPNPGVSHRITFTLPKKGNVSLGVYDLQGRRVAWLARGVMDPGTHSSTWSGAGAGSGVYFYRLKFGNETRTVRAILLD